jgi:hypothetical protein
VNAKSSARWACALFLLLASPIFAAEADVQTRSTDWCEVSVPKSVRVGDDVEIRIRLTGLDGEVFLFCDLKDQGHQMVKWGGPPRKLAQGGETVYKLRVRDLPGLESVYGLIYATRNEDDDWQEALATTSTPRVPIAGRSPLVDLEYNKSWIYVDASAGGRPLVSGDKWEVPVDYYLDPSEHVGTTTLYIWGTGPWIDTPDGKYAAKRGHVGYPGLGGRVTLTEPGRGRHMFTFTVPKGLELVRKNNRLLLLAGFRNARGEDWPWHVRANNRFVRRRGFFEIGTDVPGNLFTYDEPVRIAIRLKNVERPGEKKTLRYQVHDTTGALTARGQKNFIVAEDGQRVTIDLDVKRRGVFLVDLDVPGWEKRHTTFARIPDLRAITGGRATRFGMTSHWDAPPEEVWAIARRLGLCACRRFTRWYRLQPGPGVYMLDDLQGELETANEHGVDVWLCIVDPPPCAFPGKVQSTSYRAFEFREDVWRGFVRTVTTRLEGKFFGWEWLNEITPGGCDDPVGTYVRMCEIGTEKAKAVDPDLKTILAGGLYPRSFRVAVLTAGVGKYIDVLPVHYQNGDGVREARRDLDAAARDHVAVWEDESARGLNAWGVPPLEELGNTVQCEWVLRQWTDELAAGCQRIIYFGGRGSAAGSFGYLLDDLSPRPVAATLAVFAAKMFDAQPLGTFLLGEGGLVHLFERRGEPVLVASTYEKGGETVRLHVGSETVLITDYQGNESTVRTPGGMAELDLGTLPVFIEGADLDVLKAYVAPEILVARVGAGTSASVATARRITPRISMLRGTPGKLAVEIRNAYDRGLSGNVEIELPDRWPRERPMPFSLDTRADRVFRLPLAIPGDADPSDYPATVTVRFGWEKLPRIEKRVVLSVISPDMLGNLMPNGDFETPDAQGTGPEGWRVNGTTTQWAPAEGLGDGLGQRVLKFQGSSEWLHASRTIPVRGGQTYLYTVWVRNQDMGCGSNMTQYLADGQVIRLYDTQVIRCGDNNPHWQVFTCRKPMPAAAERASFTPVAKGPGWALFDNVHVTLFEGSDYVAEAHRAETAPTIDGRLDDWVQSCPVPLIGPNQITAQADDYAWTPEDLSAIGYLMWDEANLYVAINVRDDVHHATGSGTPAGREILRGDSLILAIDPTKRGRDAASTSLAYYLSSAAPGSGSGAHTLFRPPEHSGGRPAGHLFRDSSIYDVAVVPGEGTCVYELRIPLAELGIGGTAGTKIGLSIQIHDNDTKGPAAQMNWGEGLHPHWLPDHFGVVTFVD